MTDKEKEEILNRWKWMHDFRMALSEYDKTIANAELFLQTKLLGASSYFEANELMKQLEKSDHEAQLKYEEELRQQEVAKMEGTAKELLTDTIWSMLPDAPLSQEGKTLYRRYRQYLRDVVDLWDRKQLKDPGVMTFNEWREDPPVYKVEKKVIL